MSEIQPLLVKYAKEGQDVRTVCPFCSHTRKDKSDRCLSLRIEDGYGLYHCWHCDASGSVRMNEGGQERMLKAVSRQPIVEASGTLNAWGIDYLQKRGISKETADKAGVFSTTRYFRKIGHESDALCFPYRHKGNVYAVKYRSLEAKDFSAEGAAETLWRLDTVSEDVEDLIITEGEMDCLSLIEAGYDNAVSVPHGAPNIAKSDKIVPAEDRRFKFIWNATDQIDKAKRIIIASDCDGPGQALAEEIARRVGRDKCWQVELPEDCKDLNDVLRRHGIAALQNSVNNPNPWPVAGLYDIDKYSSDVTELFSRGLAKGFSTGLSVLDELYTVMPGQMTIVTGAPGSGKSELIDMVMVNLAEQFGWKFAICSFENPPAMHISKLLEKRVRKPFHQGSPGRMTADERDAGLEWLQEHFMFIEQADGAPSTIDSILERAKVAVRRYGVRGLIIDPYNYIENEDRDSETKQVSDLLTKVRRFAVGHDVHVWFVAHPAKLYRKQDGSLPVPTGYDISGSAHWTNKADMGMTVHQNASTGYVEVHLWKVRFKWLGKRGACDLTYDTVTGRYSDHMMEDGVAEAEDALNVQDEWEKRFG